MRASLSCWVLAASCASPGTVSTSPRSGPPPVSAELAQEESDTTRAEPAPVEESELTLGRALDLALAGHPRLAVVRARVAAAETRAHAAGRLPDPTLVVGSETARFEGESFGQAELLLGFAQPVPLGGRRGEASELARRAVDVETAEARRVLFEVRSAVRGAFAVALHAGETVGLFEELDAIRSAELELARRRADGGDAGRDDVLLAELRRAEAARDLLRARSVDAAARGELAAATGSPGRDIVSVRGDLEAVVDVPELEDLLARMEQDPALLSALARKEEARQRARLARAERVPDLTVEVLYRRFLEDDESGFDVLLGLPLPLFDGGRGRAETARREAATARAEAELARSEAERRLRRTHAEVRAALDELVFLEAEVLPRERELLELAETRHASGDLGEGDMLAARTRWIEAGRARATARRDLLVALAGSVLFDPDL